MVIIILVYVFTLSQYYVISVVLEKEIMIYLLEVRYIGSDWIPRKILDEGELHQAIDNLDLPRGIDNWRIKRIEKSDVVRINATILLGLK